MEAVLAIKMIVKAELKIAVGQHSRYFTLILMTLLISYCNGANILCVFPTPSYSHQQPFLALSHALAAKGHNLTVITTNPSKVPVKNHRDIDLSNLYKMLRNKEGVMEKAIGFSLQKRSTVYDLIDRMPVIMEFFYSNAYQSPELLNLIKEVNGTKYDLLIFEDVMAEPYLGFADLIGNPPIIGVLTMHLPLFTPIAGNPTIPSYIPCTMLPYNDRMAFWERIKNWLFTIYGFYISEMYIRPLSERYMHKYFGNTNRNLYDLTENKSLLIVSADIATGYAKPLQPNTIHVGPMHVKENPEPLPEDLQKWMDESEEGVIFFSLGSNMRTTSLPVEIRKAFVKTFKQFPKFRILCKWEADSKLPGQPDNVLVRKWLQQQSVLAHPKTRLFISQVGLQSFQEATYHAVPILGVPMFGDQDFTAKKVVTAGVGLSVEFQSITYDILYEKIKELLTNNSYKENMRRQSMITRDTVMSPVDTAVWWVEYVLRHNGAPHLRPAALDIPWYRLHLIDILLAGYGAIILYVFLSYYVVRLVYVFYRSLGELRNKKTETSKKNKKKSN